MEYDKEKIDILNLFFIEILEIMKYTPNAFLAMKISYVNKITNLCEKVGGDIQVITMLWGDMGEVVSLKMLES